MEENRNPFCIKGYLGRKWYFLSGLALAMISFMLQSAFCKDLFKALWTAAKAGDSYSLIQIFAVIPKNVTLAYLLILFFSWIVSFILNKKRLTDITGSENHSYLYSALLLIPSALVIFLNSASPLYSIVVFVSTVLGLIMLFKPGKYSLLNKPAINTEEQIQTEKVVSFWRRWGAYIIDTAFILTTLTTFISYIAPKFLYSIGNYSILVGFISFMLYFGLMNSSLNKGQTLGKMACQVKVVDENGNYLSVGKSFIRAFIFSIAVLLPMSFLLIYAADIHAYSSKTLITALVILTLINLAFKSLFLFNLKTRQTLHDLCVKSYVVTTKNSCGLSDNKTNITPIIFAFIVGMLSAVMVNNIFKTVAPVYKKYIKTVNVNNNNIDIISSKPPRNTKKKIQQPRTLTAYVYNIKDKNLAESIGQNYLKSNPNEKIVYVYLQRIINVGNTLNKTMKVYKVEWQK